MKTYYARQPILDENLKLHGYELLFRSDPKAETSGQLPLLNGDAATASVLEAVNWRGMETITQGKKAFINFTENLLLGDVASQYPKQYLTVEVLENISRSEKIFKAIAELKQRGYEIALDDYIYQTGDEPLLDLADVIKIEINNGQQSFENLAYISSKVDHGRCTLLAEKVETKEDYERARILGCKLFQGYFFARPATVLEQIVGPMRLNYLRLISEASKPTLDFKSISGIVKQDVSLSVKVLRLVNSAYFGLGHEIKNIHQAVVFLGSNELKKWISFTSLTSICEDKPSELIMMSLFRAHFCEAVARATGHGANAEAFFLAGMFSLLDALMDVEMEAALGEMQLPRVTRQALTEEDNPGRCALELIMAMERGEWAEAERNCSRLRLDVDKMSQIYTQTLEWSTGLNETLVL